MIFLADQVRADGALRPLVLMGSEVPFPFELVESRLDVAGVGKTATSRGGAARAVGRALASREQRRHRRRSPRLHHGSRPRRAARDDGERARETQVFACGPTPMLKAVAKLARDFDLPCQVALEEYMACGIGGCAGCTVLLQTPDGPAMKRVCVDGPVFDARQVYP